MRTILTLLAVLSIHLAYCKCRIVQLNCPYIIVSGHKVQKGGVIRKGATIEWTNDRQAVRLLDIKTKRQYMLTAKMFKINSNMKIEDVLIATKQLSSRSYKPSTVPELSITVPDSIFALGETLIPCGVKTDEYKFFFARYQYKGESINKRLSCSEDGIILDDKLFFIDGIRIERSDVIMDLYYYNELSGQAEKCKENVYFELLPEEVEIDTVPTKSR